VHAVDPDEFKTWLDQQKAKNSSASNMNAPSAGGSRLASAAEH
jgi:hypothetical protein